MSIRKFINLVQKLTPSEVMVKYYIPYVGFCGVTGAGLGCVNVINELNKNRNQENKSGTINKIDMLYSNIAGGCGAGVMFGIFGPLSFVGLMILGYDELCSWPKNK